MGRDRRKSITVQDCIATHHSTSNSSPAPWGSRRPSRRGRRTPPCPDRRTPVRHQGPGIRLHGTRDTPSTDEADIATHIHVVARGASLKPQAVLAHCQSRGARRWPATSARPLAPTSAAPFPAAQPRRAPTAGRGRTATGAGRRRARPRERGRRSRPALVDDALGPVGVRTEEDLVVARNVQLDAPDA